MSAQAAGMHEMPPAVLDAVRNISCAIEGTRTDVALHALLVCAIAIATEFSVDEHAARRSASALYAAAEMLSGTSAVAPAGEVL